MPTTFSNTGGDRKGVVLRDEHTDHQFNYTYYGGGFEKSQRYKDKHLVNYDDETGLCKLDGTQTLAQSKRMESWNTYQRNTWYQDHINHVKRTEYPPGLRAEFRQKGVVEHAVSLRETAIAVFDVYNDSGFVTRTRDATSVPIRGRNEEKAHFLNTATHKVTDFADSDNFAEYAHSMEGAVTFDRPESPPSGEFTESPRPFTAPVGRGSTQGRTHRPVSAEARAAAESRMRQRSAQQRAVEASRRSTHQPSSTQFTSTLPEATSTGYPNPKTMFLHKVKPIFGKTKGEVKNRTGSRGAGQSYGNSGPMGSGRPSTAPTSAGSGRSVRFSDTNNDDGKGYESKPYSATAGSGTFGGSTASQGKPRTRTMSGTSITRRHMGVAISDEDAERPLSHSQTLTSRLATLMKNSGGGTAALKKLHPTSGYERGLKGTLYANFWRPEELMRNDGKICFHPLSYDVLETLTYGPSDPKNNILKNDVFPELPAVRRELIQRIFDSLQNRSASQSVVTVEDLVTHYDAANHPAAVAGRVTKDDILEGIVFDILGENMFNILQTYFSALDHEITYEKFEHHYAAVSSATTCDTYFQRLLYATWRGLEDVWEFNPTVTKMLTVRDRMMMSGSAMASSSSKKGMDRTGVNYVNRMANTSFDQIMGADVSTNYQKRALKNKKIVEDEIKFIA